MSLDPTSFYDNLVISVMYYNRRSIFLRVVSGR